MKVYSLFLVVMIVLMLCGCVKDDIPTPLSPTIPSRVTSIDVSPESISIAKGYSYQFNSVVNGFNNPPQNVTWTVSGGIGGTNISLNGLLSIASSETATTLIVKATSTLDTTKTGTVIVTVTNTPPTVTSITVTPNLTSVIKGQTLLFNAEVNGTNNPLQSVTWAVTGSTTGTTGTNISSSGLLTVAINEMAETLIVTATSNADPTKSGTATVAVTSGQSTVTRVEVVPSTVSIAKGDTYQFNAVVYGDNNPPQTVTWSIAGGVSSGTSINTNGLLIVAINETAPTLIVTATSVADQNKSGFATVSVTNTPPSVTSVEVNPSTVSVQKGASQQFSAVVTGVNNPSQEVTWAVIGGITETSINTNGILTVNILETASILTVLATSVADSTKSGSATVNVTSIPPTVSSVEVDPSIVSVLKGAMQQFTAVVNGTNDPPQTVFWSVVGSNNSNTNIDNNGLLTVASNEIATLLSVIATSTYDTTKNATATVNVTTPPTVTTIEVNPQTAIVLIGQTQQFSAVVIGTNNPPQDVNWMVVGSNNPNTNINGSGLLSVASDETANILMVIATSAFDPTKNGSASVTVTNTTPTVLSVEVSPGETDVVRGDTQQFTVVVIGTNTPPQTVEWTVTGGSTGTNISQDGLLTVDSNETTYAILTVKATSTYDLTKYGTAIVHVLPRNIDRRVFIANDDFSGGPITPIVVVQIIRPTPFNPAVTVSVNGTNSQYVSSELYDMGNMYLYECHFIYTTLFISGSSYAITLIVDGVSSSGNVIMAYNPIVTHPPIFIPTLDMTFNWSIAYSPQIQDLFIDYSSVSGGSHSIFGPISPSLRSYLIPANTVPADWTYLIFNLAVGNQSLVGSTAFISQAGYVIEFNNDNYPSESHNKSDKKERLNTQRFIREYLK